VGAPSIDHLRRSRLLDRDQLENRLGRSLKEAPLVVAYHPVTLARDTVREADAVFEALAALNVPMVFCFPNADAGSRVLIERARAVCAARADADLHVNLDPVTYWSLLGHAAAMLGNSSSGIMEAPSLELPVVNIGLRQRGRERAENIIDVEPEPAAIAAAVARALDPGFRDSLAGMSNPYGDGHAAERIAAILAEAPLGEQLLVKRAIDPGSE
jgi:UDP-N-acetylglucosamine 2-epimerase (non-hydrolysing)/GDP/UDP-N,N'-diacetylbacillosamine 2-epimerase (hydrolysing)